MSTNYDLSSFSAAMKELYDDQKLQDLYYRNNPFWALVPKDEGFVGETKPIPIISGAAMASSNFTYALSDQAAATTHRFALTRKKNYSVATIDNETLKAGATDLGAFLRPAKFATDRALKAVANAISMSLFRSGTGSRGRISSISTGVITLTNASDVVFFEVNQTLQANATDGGTPRAALGYVIAVNRAAGTVTVASSGMGGSAADPSGWTTNDYLLVRGDNNAMISGLQGWLPTSAPTSGDNWYGVDRSQDPTRLAGVRYDGSALSIQEALVQGSQLLDREGGFPDFCFMNHASMAALINALGSKVQYEDLEGPAGIGFKAVKVYGANTEIKVIADRNCPAQTAYLLQMDTWKLESLGRAPYIETYGGPEWLRMASSDAAELRVNSYANLRTDAPGWNAVIQLGA